MVNFKEVLFFITFLFISNTGFSQSFDVIHDINCLIVNKESKSILLTHYNFENEVTIERFLYTSENSRKTKWGKEKFIINQVIVKDCNKYKFIDTIIVSENSLIKSIDSIDSKGNLKFRVNKLHISDQGWAKDSTIFFYTSNLLDSVSTIFENSHGKIRGMLKSKIFNYEEKYSRSLDGKISRIDVLIRLIDGSVQKFIDKFEYFEIENKLSQINYIQEINGHSKLYRVSKLSYLN